MKRIRVALGVLALAAGAVIPFAISQPDAHAVSGACLYWPDSGNRTYLNAWNGGPFVNVYHGCANPNGFFTILTGSTYVQLEFTGGGAWNGQCIGDAYNLPGRSDTSLDSCNPAGWGTNFVLRSTGYCDSGEAAFQDAHTGGWLGPGSPYGDGTPFYLNKSGFYCFSIG